MAVEFGHLVDQYFAIIGRLGRGATATGLDASSMTLADAVKLIGEMARQTHEAGNKLMFVGNGGSAGIASHVAIDYTKNGAMRALAFNDGAALTCLGNDLGYENVFAKQIEMHGRPGDMLIAISSSGRSPNILKAVEAARTQGCYVVTLSGFSADNPLRARGDANLFVASDQYGFVEITHLALLHAVLDLAMGWSGRAHSEGAAPDKGASAPARIAEVAAG